MNHHTTTDFWECYARLPEAVQRVADRHYALLSADPRHPSLHFKRVGRLWSVRAGSGYRALAADGPDGLVWFWIGPHDEYERLVATAWGLTQRCSGPRTAATPPLLSLLASAVRVR